MTGWRLAWRTVQARPARAVLAVVGVTVIGALLLDMLLLSRGLLLSFRDVLDSAGYDVRVVAGEGMLLARTPLAHAEGIADALRLLPEVEEVIQVQRDKVEAVVLEEPGVPGRRPASVTLVGVSAGGEMRGWRVRAGRNLRMTDGQAVPEVMISATVADLTGARLGTTLRLTASGGRGAAPPPPLEVTVAGISESALDPTDSVIATNLAAFRRATGMEGRDEVDALLVRSRRSAGASMAASAIRRARPDVFAYSNEQIVGQFNQNGFAYFRQISAVLATITLGFAFLLVTTLLSVSVNQRLSEVAALRALGVARRRIASTLLWESVWLVGAGWLLSLPLGAALAVRFDTILRSMPGFPDRLHFFVFDRQAALWHAGLLACTAVTAAAYPVWIVARLPIAATLRRETVS